ncbi:MAG TPA: polysaccharide deacetylase family protein, partial [Oscillospiraceae bacterium]|nr:polysaccharide deacetylase family protein [Oscillospiraceae bacterium]
MEKYLIVNADDFGMCHSANIAVMDLLSKGFITSSTIMTPCSWAKEAAQWAGKNPQHAIGVHLTFTSEWDMYRWAPMSDSSTDSLRDKYGFMYHNSDEFEEKADIDEVEKEIYTQIERCKKYGLTPSHLDNHMGTLYGIETGRFELLNLIFDIASEYKLPFRFPAVFMAEQFDNDMFEINVDKNLIASIFDKFTKYAENKGVALPDFLIPGEWNGPQRDSYENYREYMFELYKTFPDGVTETYIHPAAESDELKAITGSWARRVWEYKLFSDPAFQQHIK